MPRIPKLHRHRQSGQGFVVLKGKWIYLGDYKKPETRERYDRIIAEYLANGRRVPSRCLSRKDKEDDRTLVLNLAAAYVRWAQSYYVKPDGTPTSTQEVIRLALRPLKNLYGSTDVEKFGPSDLRVIQSELVRQGLSRRAANEYIAEIKRVFKFGVSRELVSPGVYQALQAVESLKKGRTEAKESKPVKPVPEAHIEAAIQEATPTIAAMIRLQVLTGMRPGELCSMKSGEISTTGDVWTYQPGSHKTEHHGHGRAVYIGPQAQEVLKPWLKLSLSEPVFSPRQAYREYLEARRELRVTPLNEGNGPQPQGKRQKARRPGSEWSVNEYRQSIGKTCKRAGVPEFAPNRLRHNFASYVRSEFGLEAAQVLLGHSNAKVSEVYAERDRARGESVIKEIG